MQALTAIGRVIREREFCATLPTPQLGIASDAMVVGQDSGKGAFAGALDDLRCDTMAVMSHYSRVLKVVIDAPPDLHDRELAFWRGALGQEMPEVYSAEYRRLPPRERPDSARAAPRVWGAARPPGHSYRRSGRRSGPARTTRRRARAAGADLVGDAGPGRPAVLRAADRPWLAERRERSALGVIMTA
jgi:hypothetical protein